MLRQHTNNVVEVQIHSNIEIQATVLDFVGVLTPSGAIQPGEQSIDRVVALVWSGQPAVAFCRNGD